MLLLDSIIEGGRGSYGKEVTYEPCSSPVAQWGGRGGHGVEAANVHSINSLVTGGMGTTWFSDPFCVGIEERCGSMPDGEPFVVTRSLTSSLCSRLTQASATPSIGGNLELTWDPTTPGCQPDLTGLAGSIGLIAIDLSSPVWPIPYGSSWLFIDPNRAIVTTAIPVDHNLLIKVVIPKIPSLVGMPYTAQVLIGPTEISGPAIGRITP